MLRAQMVRFWQKLDAAAGIEDGNKFAVSLERVAFVCLFLTALTAPHSIAATQTAWLTGMLCWLLRFALRPRPKPARTPLDKWLWVFFALAVVSSVFSYAPDISIDKLRTTAVFLIFYFVLNNLRSAKAAKWLAFALLASCMINVLWTPLERIIGRGVEIHGIAANSPLAKALLYEGDALLKVNGVKVGSPEELLADIEKTETAMIWFYRPDFYFEVQIKRADLLPGTTAPEKLGILSWNKSRNWRSTGFFGHWTTYAELLQLIASLALGLWLCFPRKFSWAGFAGAATISLIGFALLLTATRASQGALLLSGLLMVLTLARKKMLLVFAAAVLPITLGGLIYLQQSRQVGFFDTTDPSIGYRQTLYQEAVNLLVSSPRHLLVGVGMDSNKRYWREWGLYDEGKLPLGHYHSTPLQLAVELGIPALICWLVIVGVCLFSLWRGARLADANDWQRKGILLGALGGAAGFFISGLAHYNLGDQEVAMVFYIIMGIVFALMRGGASSNLA
jgi:O-antigen ligase